MNFTYIDYYIMGVPLAIVLAIAFFLRSYTKSVADFLAANRCAGRYLICSASAELGAAVMGTVMFMESFAQVGFSFGIWQSFIGVVFFMFTLFGVVTYRFRETRCLTFHQFLEVRYSKSTRVFASSLNIVSGLINFGLIPAVGGRFFVYFCGWPESLHVAGGAVPTYMVVMVSLMALSLLMALTGGQISVMITDCIEGLISGVFYLVVAFFIIWAISRDEMRHAFLSGQPGASFINPFHINGREDFNGSLLVINFIFGIMIWRGAAWNQGFSAAAKTAHEGRMAAILSSWRGYAATAMMTLVCIAAFTVLHHSDFAAQQAQVAATLKPITEAHIRGEMEMPLALGYLLAPGVKGAFCAIGLFGVLSSQGMLLHSYGATLLQDVILPLLKRPLSPRAHLLALRMTASGVALFACVFSALYKPVDYLQMVTVLISSIYIAGMAAVVWGGLYWKKGTTAGAWASMAIGAVLAITFNVLQEYWLSIQPFFLHHSPSPQWASYIAAHGDRFPLNGSQLSFICAISAFTGYGIMSLLTCKTDFAMDKMLHRGRYALADEKADGIKLASRWDWRRFIGIDEHYSRSDRVLSIVTFCWGVGWQMLTVGVVLWWLFVQKLSDEWWFNWMVVTAIWLPVTLGVVTTIWFSIGTTRDIVTMLTALRAARQNARDDGTVRDHHNLGEPLPTASTKAKVINEPILP